MELTESYFLGRVVSEQSDMGFFFLSYGFFTWQLIRELLCILIFSNSAFKKCCELFFDFSLL